MSDYRGRAGKRPSAEDMRRTRELLAPDWRAQEYEDNYWAERDAAMEDAASSWDADVLDAVSTAIDALVAGRAAAKAEVRAMLMGQGPA